MRINSISFNKSYYMKAIRIHDYGSSEKLVYEEAPDPQINGNQIIVKVYATSVNHLEVKKASGVMKERMPLDFPWIPGYDFAGIVKSTGFGNTSFKEGDKVYGNTNGGSYAELLAVDLDKVVLMPDNLTFVEAASVPHVAETAWQAIHTHGNLQSGQKVLIQGGAGAVGAYATQFAHQAGAFVYATATEADLPFLRSLKADVVIDYKNEDFTQIAKDVDLVIDLVGGETQTKSYRVLKPGGKLVTTVGLKSEEEAKEHCVIAIPMVIQQSGKDLEIITRMINENKIKTDVASVYLLEEAQTAWDNFLGTDITVSTQMHGKIVLEITSNPNAESNYGKDSNYISEPEDLPGQDENIVKRDNQPISSQPLRSEWSKGE